MDNSQYFCSNGINNEEGLYCTFIASEYDIMHCECTYIQYICSPGMSMTGRNI